MDHALQCPNCGQYKIGLKDLMIHMEYCNSNLALTRPGWE